MTAPAPLDETCTEHCDEMHPPVRRDVLGELRANVLELVEAVHAPHDRFPWSLCSRDICRDTAIALGLR